MLTQSAPVVSKLLTDVSNGYFPAMDDYIAEKILPAVYVPQTTGLIGKYGNDHLRIVNTVHAGKGNYQQLQTVTTSTDSYSIEDHGLFDVVTENDMRNFEKPFDAEIDTTMALTLAQMQAKEYGLASVLTNTGVITQNTTLSGTSQYSNLSSADSKPLENKLAADDAIRSATGRKANTLIASEAVIDKLRFHEELMNNLGFKFARSGGMSLDELSRALQVDNILVGRAMYETAKEGQTSSLASIWGKDLVYAYIAAPALRQKTLGFEFRKSGTAPRQVYRYTPNMPVNAKGIIVTDNYDQNILNANCAYLIKAAIA